MALFGVTNQFIKFSVGFDIGFLLINSKTISITIDVWFETALIRTANDFGISIFFYQNICMYDPTI
jgi:hypothetical protein